jgi:hypothetical protein
MTRDEKLATFQQLTKLPGVKTGRVFADEMANTARLLIDHPHAYRHWTIIGPDSVPGFWHLESSFRLNPGQEPKLYTHFELCLHESQFERIQ